jgi:phage shock protein E
MLSSRVWRVGAVAVVAMAGCRSTSGPSANGPASVTPVAEPQRVLATVDAAEFARLAEQPRTVILDVRTPQEFAQGHIAHAVNLNVSSPDFARHLADLDKDQTYLVVCRSGNRSARACNEMRQAGFSRLYNLDGGMLEWERAGQPVERPGTGR